MILGLSKPSLYHDLYGKGLNTHSLVISYWKTVCLQTLCHLIFVCQFLLPIAANLGIDKKKVMMSLDALEKNTSNWLLEVHHLLRIKLIKAIYSYSILSTEKSISKHNVQSLEMHG